MKDLRKFLFIRFVQTPPDQDAAFEVINLRGNIVYKAKCPNQDQTISGVRSQLQTQSLFTPEVEFFPIEEMESVLRRSPCMIVTISEERSSHTGQEPASFGYATPVNSEECSIDDLLAFQATYCFSKFSLPDPSAFGFFFSEPVSTDRSTKTVYTLKLYELFGQAPVLKDVKLIGQLLEIFPIDSDFPFRFLLKSEA